MPSLSEAVAALKRFENTTDIVNKMELLETLGSTKNETIDLVRNALKKIIVDLQTAALSPENQSLKTAVYDALLALAENYPINEVDPITMDPIALKNRVVISTGHQFDLNALIDFHNRRLTRNTRQLSDFTPRGKLLLNPFTNTEFLSDDVAHIKEVAASRNIIIQNRTGLSAVSRDQFSGPLPARFFREEPDDLSVGQRRALRELGAEGLTATHLRAWQGAYFATSHADALIYLIRTRHLSPEAAVAEISGLNNTEAGGVAAGFSRHDVTGIRDIEMMSALLKLRDDGLTPAHLRNWQGVYFANSHQDALIYLMRTGHLSPEAAVAEISGLDNTEARGVAAGYTRHDIAGIRDIEMMGALLKLRDDGLTPAHLRNWQGHFFGNSHEDALIYLIRTKRFSPEAAVAEISGLNLDQARAVSAGYSKSDVLALSTAQLRDVSNDYFSRQREARLQQHSAPVAQGSAENLGARTLTSLQSILQIGASTGMIPRSSIQERIIPSPTFFEPREQRTIGAQALGFSDQEGFNILSFEPRALFPLLATRKLTIEDARQLTQQEKRNLTTPRISELVLHDELTVAAAKQLTEEQRVRLQNGEAVQRVIGQGGPTISGMD